MEDFIIIEPRGAAKRIRLVAIRPQDSERLRQWKNANREYFFYQKVISKTEQNIWMERYFADEDNFLFLVEHRGESIGCLGFRKRPDGADIYNVIMARNEFAKKGLMSEGLELLCSFIRQCHIKRIYLKVLKSNESAQIWYQQNHFQKTEDCNDFFVMEFQGKEIIPVHVTTIKKGILP